MKRMLKMFTVVMVCLSLSVGLGIPESSSTELGSSAIVTIQAKQKMNKKFKKAMDEYLKFYKKYCKFMKKYKKSTNTASMMSDYTKLLEQQQKVNSAFGKWKKKKLNATELAYYTKINSKVIAMLAKV